MLSPSLASSNQMKLQTGLQLGPAENKPDGLPLKQLAENAQTVGIYGSSLRSAEHFVEQIPCSERARAESNATPVIFRPCPTSTKRPGTCNSLPKLSAEFPSKAAQKQVPLWMPPKTTYLFNGSPKSTGKKVLLL